MFCTVIFTNREPREVFRDFLRSLLGRWPSAMFEEAGKPEIYVSVSDFPDDRLPIDEGDFHFYRDAAMIRHSDEEAYAPMADGDGMLGLVARTRRDVAFRFGRLEELHVGGEPQIGSVKPYDGWLCSPSIIEITVVTPRDPEGHRFSAWAREAARRACRGSSGPGLADV